MKKFMTLWTGELISNIGSGMTAFALSVYVYQVTRSAAYVSLVALLAYMPTILLNPIGGIFADRFDRRLMMICGDFFSALGLVYILISMQTGNKGILPIIIGVTINSVFVSLLDPSYRATITDLLSEEEYAKASGLVQMAGNAKYLISPALAGLILGVADIRVILLLDIGTFLVTLLTISCVRRTIRQDRKVQEPLKLREELAVGFQYIRKDKAVASLVWLMAFVCFFMGFVQTLMVPMVLPLGSAKTVGIMESVSAIGMLIGSVVIGVCGIQKHHAKVLVISLIACGCFMALIGTSTRLSIILAFSILFFMAMPFTNTCADVLIRVRIPNELQGRVWGMISLLTQLGSVIAFATCGLLADQVFEKLMRKDGILAGSIGRLIGTGEGRGIGLMIILAGISMIIMAFILGSRNSIQAIQVESGEYELENMEK